MSNPAAKARSECARISFAERMRGKPLEPRSVIRAVRRDKELRIQLLPRDVGARENAARLAQGSQIDRPRRMQAEIKKR